ncbi:3',5'-cyclic adenosine monophosphate phosphodiesterase CpdA [Paraburkholderia aspalathi]|uniref:metallophosphoesterase family protein n=1 Tax=Paraburkholderia aspalathi TaxID=1324617 RepID=UPI001B2A6A53|nr:metallophosphoesterase [Paraburkholderia aspalathi]CAE6872338.1 3',5'-cyclic adenosine monophosphate phosphodiesterase CpdA [Paraburkholderia aspalathi]
MSLSYIHLSDIHFGQEVGGSVFVHNDVKERLIDDVRDFVRGLPGQRADGIIVSGDIVYAGKPDEYAEAAIWLDRVAAAAGCLNTAIQVVPGNHDIDRAKITHMTKRALEEIATKGEAELDLILGQPLDREMLYGRFEAYRPFAEAYGCPLDFEGGNAGARLAEVAPNRLLRFIGLNTALICGALKNEKGKLLLGARQRIVPMNPGEEVVLIAHHPLDWLQDSNDAARYVRNRARVLITGHEHNPSVRVEGGRDDSDLLVLAAGATVPPEATDDYNYAFSVLQFEWDAAADGLRVIVSPRAWSDDDKMFRADAKRAGGEQLTFNLGCPNFRKHPLAVPTGSEVASDGRASTVPDEPPAHRPEAAAEDAREGVDHVSDHFAVLRLRFFRDLSPGNRIAVLVKLRALPDQGNRIKRPAFQALEPDSVHRIRP